MIRLFTIQDHTPVPTDEALALIQELFTLNYNKQKGDNSGRKRERGAKEMMFLYYYVDFRSAFSQYPKEERKKAALEGAGLPEDYKISEQLENAIKIFTDLQYQSRKLRLLRGARVAVDKLAEYFENVSFNVSGEYQEDENGDPVITDSKDPDAAKDVMANVSNLAKVVKGLDDMEELVKKGMEENTELRGDSVPGRLG